ncbi:MAG: hypothetical protein ACFFAH_11030 [Promethearchaeota archaeon]
MNKYSTIEDKSIAQDLKRPLDEIKEVMQKLFKSQKKNKWLIVFLSNRYIFYREDTIRKFEELYNRGFNEKRIFDDLKRNVNIRTRAEIKAIIDTLINFNRLETRKISASRKMKQSYK